MARALRVLVSAAGMVPASGGESDSADGARTTDPFFGGQTPSY
jgi:hypothetical protein